MIWNWQFAADALPEILRGLSVTLGAVFWGMLIAVALGLAWAICRRSSSRLYAWPATALVEFVRSTPLLVQIYFLFAVLPLAGVVPSPFLTGVLALGLHYSCYTSEVYRAGINAVPVGQWRAAQALNLTRWQTYRHVVLPQAIPPVVPALGNYLIAMFKDTPMLSAITVLELLQRAKIVGKESARFLEPFTIVGVVYLILSLISGYFVSWLERRMKLERG
jgi:polar amino acid transport system permease protein